jgi:dTDP-glucose 4,6-dehydratase
MKLLVTGGAGFIGSNFVHYWLKQHPQDRVVNLDKLTYAGHLSSLKDVKDKENYKFVKGNIADGKVVSKAMKGVDWVVHFAAESHVDRSITDPQVFVQTNVVGTQVLLEAAREEGVKRFHQVSTDEVFGALPLKSKKKFSEQTRYNPNNPYAASKAAADHLARTYQRTFGLPVTITNCANNYGPYQDPEKFIPRMITNLIEGKPVMVYGDGKYVRDWLYVEDHCRAIERVLMKGKVGETYLIGGLTEEINNLEVATKLLRLFGKGKSELKMVKDRPGHDRRYIIDWRKINRELGWRPKHDFDTWLGETVNWYRGNGWWWKPLKAEAEKLYEKTGQN